MPEHPEHLKGPFTLAAGTVVAVGGVTFRLLADAEVEQVSGSASPQSASAEQGGYIGSSGAAPSSGGYITSSG